MSESRYAYRRLVGSNIRRHREQQGMCIHLLAILAGVSSDTILGYETATMAPTASGCRAIAVALGVPIGTILPEVREV